MTGEDILLVQRSWLAITPVKQITAELFYVKLSELDPGLRLLFDDDLRESNRKFVQLLDATVRGLDRTDVLMAAVREVGLRNPTFGLADTHHGTVAAALLWTLQKALRHDFTPAVKAAWIKIFGVLSREVGAGWDLPGTNLPAPPYDIVLPVSSSDLRSLSIQFQPPPP